MSYLDKFKFEALTAGIGFNDGANNGFWRVQPRLKFGKGAGQWIEMGAELRAAFKINGKVSSIPGRAAGSGGTPDTVRLLVQNMSDKGVPDGIYEVKTKHVELIGATLPESYLKSKGIKTEGAGKGFGGLTDAADIPELADMTSASITPDDIRLVNDGINSPEGKEQAAFKDSPEGKAIAELPEDAAAPISGNDAVDQATTSESSKSKEQADLDAAQAELDQAYTDYFKIHNANRKLKGKKFEEGDQKAIEQAKVVEEKHLAVNQAKRRLEASSVDANPIDETSELKTHDQVIDLALNKAGNDEPVNVDDLITSMAKASVTDKKTPVSQLKGQKINTKPFSMEPGDIFSDRGNDYVFEGLGERDRVSKTQSVFAKDYNTGKSEEIILDTDVTTPVFRPDAVQPEAPKIAELPKAPEAPKAPEVAPTPDVVPAPEVKAEPAPKVPKAKKAAKTDKTGTKGNKVDPTPAPELDQTTPEAKAIDAGREDKGQDIDFSPISDEELFGRKLDTKGSKSGADAIVEQLLKDYPDAAVTPDGTIVLERRNFIDPDGKNYTMESRVSRTEGNQFMVSQKVTDENGESTEYFQYDYKDSYSAIHGKTNGVRRMSRILAGEESPLQEKLLTGKKAGQPNPNYLKHFGPGTGLADRLGYFRDKFNDKAGNKNLQEYRLLTLPEMTDRILDGRDRTFNPSLSNKQLGNVQRSFIQSFWEAAKNKDSIGMAEVMSGLMGRLPDNEASRQVALSAVRAGVKRNLPEANQKELSGFVTAAYGAMLKKYDFRNQVRPPHVSGDGITPVEAGQYVAWYNNEGDRSVGKVVALVERVGSGSGPNEYTDAAYVVFGDGTRRKLVTKNMDIIEAGHVSDLTAYKGWITKEDKLARRGFDPDVYAAADNKRRAVDIEEQGFNPATNAANPNLGTQGNEDAKVAKADKTVKPAADLITGDGIFDNDFTQVGTVMDTDLTEIDGQPVVVVTYRDLKTNEIKTVGYLPDQMVGGQGPKA